MDRALCLERLGDRILHSCGRVPRSRFLIGERNKEHRKEMSAITFFSHRSKLQAGTSNENQLTDSSVCPRLLPLHSRLFSQC
jgi:hypothetical protein